MDNSKQAIAMAETGDYNVDVYQSFIEIYGEEQANDYGIEEIDYRYQGEFKSDVNFVKGTLTFNGSLVSEMPYYICIDWKKTVYIIMQDYSNDNRHYFHD